ncbi:MAG: hypothetical protein M1823_003054 [Watsoniomyces obsoletus]|nr:MAG: hypothetical protein M1823_003054 [Watsoniomyces obsoletus]
MPLLSAVLAPEAVGKLHDAVLCLSKFSETVSIEAQHNKLVLSALNSSKSAFASFTLHSRFFAKYHLVSSQLARSQSRTGSPGRFTCQLYNKALVSVFKGRLLDARDRDTSVERCELSIQEGPHRTECRLVVKMGCKHGVLKTCKLTYEAAEVTHALFDRESANNRWTISASSLKDYSEHFGPKTEQLDMYPESGRYILKSYVEKVVNGKEVLRQALQTSVAVDTLEFQDFIVQEKLHVVISVKDFKAIVLHADTLNVSVSARYSYASRPLQITYGADGMDCEFTLMTTGELPGGLVERAGLISGRSSVAPITRNGRTSAEPNVPRNTLGAMAPPERPTARLHRQASARESEGRRRPSPPLPQASLDDQSLFFPEREDDDRGWDAYNFDNENEDQLGWDGSANDLARPSLVPGDPRPPPQSVVRPVGDGVEEERIAPTQRVSQVWTIALCRCFSLTSIFLRCAEYSTTCEVALSASPEDQYREEQHVALNTTRGGLKREGFLGDVPSQAASDIQVPVPGSSQTLNLRHPARADSQFRK